MGCGAGCDPTCLKPHLDSCDKNCKPGCYCKSGTVRNEKGECIEEKHCHKPSKLSQQTMK